MRNAIAASLAVFSFVWGEAAFAQMSERDLAIVGRALSFIEGSQSGERVVALIYDDAGQAEADALNAAMSGGYSARDITMVPRMVPLSDVSGGLAGADAAILLGGLSAGDAGISSTAASNGVLTVSSDMVCVQSGQCVMSLQSNPSVRIVVNESAASSASVSFTSAFSMMIERI